MRVISSYEISKIESRFIKRNKNLGEYFFVSEIIASEDVAINFLY